jgi:hypothetical protein
MGARGDPLPIRVDRVPFPHPQPSRQKRAGLTLSQYWERGADPLPLPPNLGEGASPARFVREGQGDEGPASYP